MQTTIAALNQSEVLRYLGYQGTEIPPQLSALLTDTIREALRLIQPKYHFKQFTLTKTGEGIHLKDTDVILHGQDIQSHLENCEEVFVLCVTIGLEIEKAIRLYMLTTPDRGVILDSAASTAVEHLADFVEQEIVKLAAEENLNITWRFSPGYGDLPLGIQKPLLTAMDSYRKIGLTLNSSLLLTPNKSVTALIGLSDTSRDKRDNKCDYCNNKAFCAFHKRGTFC